MHTLQHHIVSLPSSVRTSDEGRSLCCRGKCHEKNGVLVCIEAVQWDTFFNVFPVQVYFQNTNIKDIQLQATVCGCGRLMVHGICPNGSTLPLDEKVFSGVAPQKLICKLPITKEYIYYYMEIVPEFDTVSLYGAVWETSDLPQNTPRIALVICTHQRKTQLIKNLAQIARYTHCNPSTIDVLVVDNGGDLILSDLSIEKEGQSMDGLYLFANPCNLGGAGGFARGIHEAVRQNKYTHVLLMDDDISLHPEMLNRLVQLLRYASQPQTLAIGAVMLDKERPSHVVEWGASYPGYPKALAVGRDISLTQYIISPKEPIDYCAWTLFCYPLTRDISNELPLPIFIRCDDAEFGLRLGIFYKVKIVIPCSLSIWHHNFTENKPILLFHTLRNELIINEIYKKLSFKIFCRYCSIPLYYMIRKNKKSALYALYALENFLQGECKLLSLEYENDYFKTIETKIYNKKISLNTFYKEYIFILFKMFICSVFKVQHYKYITKNSKLVWNKYFRCI